MRPTKGRCHDQGNGRPNRRGTNRNFALWTTAVCRRHPHSEEKRCIDDKGQRPNVAHRTSERYHHRLNERPLDMNRTFLASFLASDHYRATPTGRHASAWHRHSHRSSPRQYVLSNTGRIKLRFLRRTLVIDARTERLRRFISDIEGTRRGTTRLTALVGQRLIMTFRVNNRRAFRTIRHIGNVQQVTIRLHELHYTDFQDQCWLVDANDLFRRHEVLLGMDFSIISNVANANSFMTDNVRIRRRTY